MRRYKGWVKELHIEPSGMVSARIACPPRAVPQPGRYLLASWGEAVLSAPLFLEAGFDDGFLAAPPAALGWEPGIHLELRGPRGDGFSLPADTRRLVLAALGDTVSRLLPVAESALQQEMAVALFSDAVLPSLPSAMEASPLATLPDALSWADFLVLDLPLEEVPRLRDRLEIAGAGPLTSPGQALVLAPMPCAGLAGCGVCALRTRRGWKLVCEDGPVFPLQDLLEIR
jgi:hypothetical protein